MRTSSREREVKHGENKNKTPPLPGHPAGGATPSLNGEGLQGTLMRFVGRKRFKKKLKRHSFVTRAGRRL